MGAMAGRTILVVEDDAAIRQGVTDALAFAGFGVLQAADGPTGMQLALCGEWDLMLLDLVLPGGDGLDILARVREHRPTQPVIILTAMGREEDRVRGLSLGADDYVVKPFSVKELLARAAAVLRRSPERPTDLHQVTFAGGLIDLERREVRYGDGQRCDLSQREIELLRYLACNAGRAISREEILRHVWRLEPTGLDTRTIDMHIARLREKLHDDGSQPAVLLTVRGKGYMLAVQGEPT